MKSTIKLFYICIILLLMLCTSFRWPLENGKITSTFGESRWDHFHDGIDMISSDDRVYPIAEGRLIYFWAKSLFPLDNYPGGGNYKILEHANRVYSLYLHLSDGFTLKNSYTEREYLGISGNTGRSSGKHLHFSLLKISERTSVNPFLYLPAYEDRSEPSISGIYIRVGDRYFAINEKADIRLTRHYPLLIDIRDSILGKEKLGIFKLSVYMNDKKAIDVDFTKICFTKKGLTLSDYTFHDLFDERGYYKVNEVSYRNGLNTVKIITHDYSGNSSVREILFNVKKEF